MAEVASQPRPIAGPSTTTTTTNNLTIPLSFRSSHNLNLNTFSPVTQNGSFEFDRIVKQGQVLKRTRKTKSWKPIFMVLRPNLLSIYRDAEETKLRHQITLSDLTAVARQKDPRRKNKPVFGLFSPSRNFHLEASSDKEAQDWVEHIRREARIGEDEEEMTLMSPGGANESEYQGFERSIDARVTSGMVDKTTGYSSSDAEGLSPSNIPSNKRQNSSGRRARGDTTSTRAVSATRHPSYAEYSGAEGAGSYSDFSDTLASSSYPNTNTNNTARVSALSVSPTDNAAAGRPSTSSTIPTTIPATIAGTKSRSSTHPQPTQNPQGPADDTSRVVFQTPIYLLSTRKHIRHWKLIWLVLRPTALALYKSSSEYTPLLILPLENIIDAVEIDPISKSKKFCLQVIGVERNWRLAALDEEALVGVLGAVKSLIARRRRGESVAEGAA